MVSISGIFSTSLVIGRGLLFGVLCVGDARTGCGAIKGQVIQVERRAARESCHLTQHVLLRQRCSERDDVSVAGAVETSLDAE